MNNASHLSPVPEDDWQYKPRNIMLIDKRHVMGRRTKIIPLM